MILIDTSAWIEYDRATGSSADLRLSELVGADAEIAVTEPVIMELLAGARDNVQERRLRRLLERFALLRFDAVVDFEGASLIYRRCRSAGVTPRGLIDCMVAAVAQRENATLLAYDADFSRVSEVVGLRLDDASLRPY